MNFKFKNYTDQKEILVSHVFPLVPDYNIFVDHVLIKRIDRRNFVYYRTDDKTGKEVEVKILLKDRLLGFDFPKIYIDDYEKGPLRKIPWYEYLCMCLPVAVIVLSFYFLPLSIVFVLFNVRFCRRFDRLFKSSSMEWIGALLGAVICITISFAMFFGCFLLADSAGLF